MLLTCTYNALLLDSFTLTDTCDLCCLPALLFDSFTLTDTCHLCCVPALMNDYNKVFTLW